MDLTKQYPRSPYSDLGGYVMLGRTIDKARAHNAGKLGDYSYDCPLDRLVFDFLGISHEALAEAVKTRPADDEILGWVKGRARSHTVEEVQKFNEDMKARAPVTEEQKAYFLEAREKVAPGRTDVTTWFDLIEADEKRL
jgi:hypothetical protein